MKRACRPAEGFAHYQSDFDRPRGLLHPYRMGGEHISTERVMDTNVRPSTLALFAILLIVSLIYFFYLPQ